MVSLSRLRMTLEDEMDEISSGGRMTDNRKNKNIYKSNILEQHKQ